MPEINHEDIEADYERLLRENADLRTENTKLELQIARMDEQQKLMAALYRGATPTDEGNREFQQLRDQLNVATGAHNQE